MWKAALILNGIHQSYKDMKSCINLQSHPIVFPVIIMLYIHLQTLACHFLALVASPYNELIDLFFSVP
jgi:hypothetical protein